MHTLPRWGPVQVGVHAAAGAWCCARAASNWHLAQSCVVFNFLLSPFLKILSTSDTFFVTNRIWDTWRGSCRTIYWWWWPQEKGKRKKKHIWLSKRWPPESIDVKPLYQSLWGNFQLSRGISKGVCPCFRGGNVWHWSQMVQRTKSKAWTSTYSIPAWFNIQKKEKNSIIARKFDI